MKNVKQLLVALALVLGFGAAVAQYSPTGAGISASGTVGTTSATLATAAQFPHQLTIQNTSTSLTLYVSFNTTTTAANGFAIGPGAALTLNGGLASAITALGSAAGVTYNLIGY
jgi:hypothetical protein